MVIVISCDGECINYNFKTDLTKCFLKLGAAILQIFMQKFQTINFFMNPYSQNL